MDKGNDIYIVVTIRLSNRKLNSEILVMMIASYPGSFSSPQSSMVKVESHEICTRICPLLEVCHCPGSPLKSTSSTSNDGSLLSRLAPGANAADIRGTCKLVVQLNIKSNDWWWGTVSDTKFEFHLIVYVLGGNQGKGVSIVVRTLVHRVRVGDLLISDICTTWPWGFPTV